MALLVRVPDLLGFCLRRDCLREPFGDGGGGAAPERDGEGEQGELGVHGGRVARYWTGRDEGGMKRAEIEKDVSSLRVYVRISCNPGSSAVVR